LPTRLLRAFSGHFVEKHYLARVYGTLQKDATLHGWLSKDSNAGVVKVFDEKVKGAAEIITTYKVLGVDGNTTLLDVMIFGGKTHQIRAHLAHTGHFILGDGKYGRDEINRNYGFKKQQLTANKLVFNFPKNSPLFYLNSTKIEL
jgi:Pseudouridylate synthases, 23S RNA-specific